MDGEECSFEHCNLNLLPHLDYHRLESSSDQADESVSENEGDKEDKGPPKKRKRKSEGSPKKKKTKEKKTAVKKEKKAAKPKKRGLEPNNDIVVVEKDPLFEERYSVINLTLHQIIFSSCIVQFKHGSVMGKWGPALSSSLQDWFSSSSKFAEKFLPNIWWLVPALARNVDNDNF